MTGDSPAPPTLSWIQQGLVNLWSVFEDTLSHLTTNTFFAILLVSSLVIVAMKLIHDAKNASK